MLALLTSVLFAQSVADAEREFSAYTAQHGMKKGFLAYFAEDAVMFAPEPTNAREHLSKLPDTPPTATLSWSPVFTVESQGHDIGVNTGPYTVKGKDGQALGSGIFFSIWERKGSGPWKVVLDLGQPGAAVGPRSHPDEVRATMWEGASGPFAPPPLKMVCRSSVRFDTSAVLVYGRRGLFEGKAAIATALPFHPSLQPIGGKSSSEGTFGYVYGSWAPSPGKKGYFCRFWHRTNKDLQVVAEVLQEP